MDTPESMATTRRQQARSFGPVAALYDRVRPGYPTEAIEWAFAPLGHGNWTIADIGAGTGKMTRQLADLGHVPIAVEPDPRLRAWIASTSPNVSVCEGEAEALPLDPASVDGAIAAQAYHWFDHDRTHRELARVIRSGGVFAAIWNDRDDSVAWSAAFSRIVERERRAGGSAPDRRQGGPLDFGSGFATVEIAEFHHSTPHTAQSLIDLARSRSYFITATPRRAAEIEEQLRDLVENHPDLRGRNEFHLPYRTRVHRAVRR